MTGSFARRASATVTAANSSAGPGPGSRPGPSPSPGLSTRGQQGPAWPPAQPPLPLMAASGAGRLKAGTAWAFPLSARDGAEGSTQGAKAGGLQANTAGVLTGVEAQVTGVEVPDHHAGTQPDALQVTVASVQIHQQDVVQVKLQAGPAGTRGGHTCRCAGLVPKSAPTLSPTKPQHCVLGLFPVSWPQPRGPHPDLPLSLLTGRLSQTIPVSHSCLICTVPSLGVPASQMKGN